MTHAILSPSGASKWMACPGAVALEQTQQANIHDYTIEGTVAHHIAAYCRKNKMNPAAFRGRLFQLMNGEIIESAATKVPRLRGWKTDHYASQEVTKAMVERVQIYLDHIGNYAVAADAEFVEERVPIDHITGEEGAEGTTDFGLFKGCAIQAQDYKDGGFRVDAENNPQLLMYGSGLRRKAEARGFHATKLILAIHQPRIQRYGPDVWQCDIEVLDDFEKKAKACAVQAKKVLDMRLPRLDDYLPYLNPGAKQCQFCDAKAVCPAQRKVMRETAFNDFEPIAAVAPTSPEVVQEVAKPLLTMPTFELSDEELARYRGLTDLLRLWADAMDDEAYRRGMQGRSPPGYKIVKGRDGNRAWKDEDAVKKLMHDTFRMKTEEIYSMDVISPTQAERLFKESPRRWAKLEEYVFRDPGKPTLVAESDKRPPLQLTPPEDDFEVLNKPLTAGDLI